MGLCSSAPPREPQAAPPRPDAPEAGPAPAARGSVKASDKATSEKASSEKGTSRTSSAVSSLEKLDAVRDRLADLEKRDEVERSAGLYRAKAESATAMSALMARAESADEREDERELASALASVTRFSQPGKNIGFDFYRSLFHVYNALPPEVERNSFIQLVLRDWRDIDPELLGNVIVDVSAEDDVAGMLAGAESDAKSEGKSEAPHTDVITFWGHVAYLLRSVCGFDDSEASVVIHEPDASKMVEPPSSFLNALNGKFDVSNACKELAETLHFPSVIDKPAFMKRAIERWRVIDKENFGFVTIARLRAFVQRTRQESGQKRVRKGVMRAFNDYYVPEETLLEEVKQEVNAIMKEAESPSFLTFEEFARVLLGAEIQDKVEKLKKEIKKRKKKKTGSSGSRPTSPSSSSGHRSASAASSPTGGERRAVLSPSPGTAPPSPFKLDEALSQLRKQLPTSEEFTAKDASSFLDVLREQYSRLDPASAGVVTRNQLRRLFWQQKRAEAADPKSLPETLPSPVPEDVEQRVNVIMQGTSGGDSFTFWDYANLLLAGRGLAAVVPTPSQQQLQQQHGGDSKRAPFDLDEALRSVVRQLTRFKAKGEIASNVNPDEVAARLRTRWSGMDRIGQGVVTRRQLAAIMVEAQGGPPAARSLAKDFDAAAGAGGSGRGEEKKRAEVSMELVDAQVDALMQAASHPDRLSFWDFVNMVVSAELGRETSLDSR